MKILLAVLGMLLFLSACGSNGQEPLPSATPPFGVNGTVEPTPEPTPEAPPDIPSHDSHEIRLEINPAAHTVMGQSLIDFTNRTGEVLDMIILRVHPHIEILHIFIEGEPLAYEHQDMLTLRPEIPILPEQTVQLRVQYSADIPMTAASTGANENALWFGAFLPQLSIADAPVATETVNYSVYITHPEGYTVVGTGVKSELVTGDAGSQRTGFTANLARDFAFAISPDFIQEQVETESGIEIRFYFYTEDLDMETIAETARRAVTHFEGLVGRLPFGHISVVETGMDKGAAFSQAVFMDSEALVKGNTDEMVRGIARQWFSNVVGNYAHEQWLNEGLVRFMQAGFSYPDEAGLRRHMEQRYAEIAERRDLHFFAHNGDNMKALGIKSELMMYALMLRMGEEPFWNFIGDFYKAFPYRVAGFTDFMTMLELAYEEGLAVFWGAWMDVETVPPLP